jgi:biopolymer transport protein ExbD
VKFKGVLIVGLTCLLLAMLYFDVEFSYENKEIIVPSIIIKINPENYEINGRFNTDVISLLREELNINSFNESPNILISSGDEIQYARVADTMDTLKSNGYENIGISVEDKKL